MLFQVVLLFILAIQTVPDREEAGQPVLFLSAPSLEFADQEVGLASAPQQEKLTNGGTAILKFSDIAITGGQFSEIGSCRTTLAPRQSCYLFVTFRPTARGAHTSTITISDNAADSPQAIPLSGTGTNFELSPVSLKFGAVEIGQQISQTVTLSNSAGIAQTINAIDLTGSRQFSETDDCGISLSAGASCTITITYTPLYAKETFAHLVVSGGGATQIVFMSGTGVLGAIAK